MPFRYQLRLLRQAFAECMPFAVVLALALVGVAIVGVANAVPGNVPGAFALGGGMWTAAYLGVQVTAGNAR